MHRLLFLLAFLATSARADLSEGNATGDLPEYHAKDANAAIVSERNLLASERFWPYQVALHDAWQPPGRTQAPEPGFPRRVDPRRGLGVRARRLRSGWPLPGSRRRDGSGEERQSHPRGRAGEDGPELPAGHRSAADRLGIRFAAPPPLSSRRRQPRLPVRLRRSGSGDLPRAGGRARPGARAAGRAHDLLSAGRASRLAGARATALAELESAVRVRPSVGGLHPNRCWPRRLRRQLSCCRRARGGCSSRADGERISRRTWLRRSPNPWANDPPGSPPRRTTWLRGLPKLSSLGRLT